MSESRVDEVYEPKRQTDHNAGARVSRFIVRYSPIIVLVYTIVYTWLISTGFGWNTPKETLDSLNVRIEGNRLATVAALDSVISHADQLDGQAQRTLEILEIFSLDLCLRRRADPYIYRRLKCNDLLRGAN